MYYMAAEATERIGILYVYTYPLGRLQFKFSSIVLSIIDINGSGGLSRRFLIWGTNHQI